MQCIQGSPACSVCRAALYAVTFLTKSRLYACTVGLQLHPKPNRLTLTLTQQLCVLFVCGSDLQCAVVRSAFSETENDGAVLEVTSNGFGQDSCLNDGMDDGPDEYSMVWPKSWSGPARPSPIA